MTETASGVTDHLTELAAHLEDTSATVRRNLTLVFAEVGAVASTIQTGTDVYHPETRVRNTERE